MGDSFLEQYGPVTWTIGFFECSCAKMGQVMRAWSEGAWGWQGISFDEQELVGPFDTVVSSLLPLTDTIPSKLLLVPTASSWTAWFDNRWLGGDQNSAIDFLATQAGALRAVRATCEPGHSVIMDVHDAQGQLRRSIYVSKDGRRWRYYTYGEPFDFEQTDRYKARSIPERFTREMLRDYLLHMGIDMFSPGFYQATASNPARLISPRGVIFKVFSALGAVFTTPRSYGSFEEARRALKEFYQEKSRERRIDVEDESDAKDGPDSTNTN